MKKGRPSRMTTERLDKLKALHFIWDATQKRGSELTSPPRNAICAGQPPAALLNLAGDGALQGGLRARGAPRQPNAGCDGARPDITRITQLSDGSASSTSASVCETLQSEATSQNQQYRGAAATVPHRQRSTPTAACQPPTSSAACETSRRLFPPSFVPQMSQLVQVVPANIQTYPNNNYVAPQVFHVVLPSSPSGSLPHPVTALPPMRCRGPHSPRVRGRFSVLSRLVRSCGFRSQCPNRTLFQISFVSGPARSESQQCHWTKRCTRSTSASSRFGPHD
jgi:hypothetical protein